MYKPTPMLSFFWGLFLGLILSAFLFNSFSEATDKTVAQAEVSTVPTPRNDAEKVTLSLSARADLLQKSYTMRDGAEDVNLASLLHRNGHLVIFEQMLEETTAEVADLIQSRQSFTAAQFYAALVRIKQRDEEMQAKAALEQLKPQQPALVVRALAQQ